MKLTFQEAVNPRPSISQLELIEWMEDFSCPKFTGTTAKEADTYIEQNFEYYRLMQIDSWGWQYE